jgi:hypothetical protein
MYYTAFLLTLRLVRPRGVALTYFLPLCDWAKVQTLRAKARL